MSPVTKVAIAGATGNLGPAILKALVETKNFQVTVLTRPESKHTFPSNVTVKTVDYKSSSSLVEALKGQDAFVSTLSANALEDQKLIIDACISTGVKRFIPAEFGSDTTNPLSAKLPVFGGKVSVQQYLKERTASNKEFSYSLIINGPFLDWGMAVGFLVDVKGKKAVLKDGGDRVFSATTLASIGQAVVGTLLHPDETANRAIYVRDINTTQNQLISLAKKFVGEDGWEISNVKSADLEKSSNEALAKGDMSPGVWVNYIYRSIFGEGFGSEFTKVDNELVGIKGLDEKGLEALMKGIAGA